MNILSDNISEYLEKVFGEEFVKKYEEYVSTGPVQYLRFNRLDNDTDHLLERLREFGISVTAVEKVPFAYKVNEGYATAGKTLDFTLGKYYIQSLSSMLPPLVLEPEKDDTVLDIAAAPGSKSTQISELMEGKGTLYANEVSGERTRALVHNFEKIATVNFGVINKKGEQLSKFFDSYFDKILVDAPCTGLGILQKKGEVNNWWTTRHSDKLSELQWKLLVSAVKMLKTGGTIVYSTCTLTLEENEFVLNKLLEKYPVELEEFELPVKSHPAVTQIDDIKLDASLSRARRIYPWDINSEGFFIAKIRKTADTPEAEKLLQARNEKYRFYNYKDKAVYKYIKHLSEAFGIEEEVFAGYRYYFKKTDIFFTHKDWDTRQTGLFQRIGHKLGVVDRNDNPYINPLAARVLGPYATENITELETEEELSVYLSGGTIRKDFGRGGKQIIKYGNYFLGSGVISKEGLKSQFPRSMRTAEILIKKTDPSG